MTATASNLPRKQARKRYVCNHEGCGKAFTRSSHLLRHSQNHTDIAWRCDRCEASFKRQDLLERHTIRHGNKDKRAGGSGLGKLVSKRRKHPDHGQQFRQQPDIDNNFLLTSPDESPQQNGSIEFQRPPDSLSPQSLASNVNSYETNNDSVEKDINYSTIQHPSSLNLPSNMNIRTEQECLLTEGQGYLDISGYTSYAGQGGHPQILTPPRDELSFNNGHTENNYLDLVDSNDIEDFINSLAMLEQQSHNIFDPFKPYQSGQIVTSPNQMETSSIDIDPSLVPIRNFASPVHDGMVTNNDQQSNAGSFEHQINGRNEQEKDTVGDSYPLIRSQKAILQLPSQIRESILHLIMETHPVTPNGTPISMDTPELRLESMQDSLDLFVSRFNTSYPILHLASFDIESVDRILLLSMILLGSTYKSKDAHQMSVCLYDALIPHVFGGLSNNSSPELHRLQSLLLLDCYGMYRAGPSQRYNALLLHRVLLNSICIISRYHVKAKIGLPAEMIMSASHNFRNFAYAEQYKRLILLFFMWDVQNACFFSATSSLSIDELDITLPCPNSTWLAATEAEWEALRLNESDPETLASTVKFYLDDGGDISSPREDMLTLTLSLHGLMSICNGMRSSSKLHTFHDLLDGTKISSTTWRPHMCTALEFWKARFDAFAMDNIQALKSEILHCDFQRDSMGVFAIYRAAYIVVNVEVRHLQIAAGANTIFGHAVEESDYAVSTEWVTSWARDSPESVGRATWQAGQMFREGMLNLKDWYVHDVFHYPWSLYLATLTCWAAGHFTPTTNGRHVVSDHNLPSRGAPREDSRKSMNRLVSMLASATPSNMARLVKKFNTNGLTKEMAKYLRTVRWAAAHEAMVVLEGLSTG